jgi:hypothetical protein
MKKALLLAALLSGALPGIATAAPPATAQRLRAAQEQRQALAAELDALARRIEARKAATRGSVLPDRELESLLQRSQTLAEQLGVLHRQEETARSAHRQELERLLREGEAAVRAARSQGDAAATARAEAERDRLRAQLDALRPQTAAPLGLPSAPEDDPDEVREQADLLRDQRDRVLARLELVEERLEDAREEAYVARELRDFVDEGNLFDDGERVMRASRTVTRTTSGDKGADPAPAQGAPPGQPTTDRGEGDGVGSGGPFVPGDLDNEGTPPPESPAPGPSITTSTLVGTRPLGAGEIAARGLPALDGDESLDELVAQQQALRELARELERRAGELDRRARRFSAPGNR